MSLGDSLVSLVSATTRQAARKVTLTAARTVAAVPVPGAVRGVARSVARAVTGADRQDAHEARAGAWSAPTDPVPRPAPAPLRDPVATEPTAATRAEAHGGSACRHADDWTDELVEDDEPATEPVPSDEPLITPGAARAVRKEARVMQRGARPRT